MITRIVLAFVLFAGLAYYFNVDVRALVDRSGVPTWLSEHGISVTRDSSSTSTTTP